MLPGFLVGSSVYRFNGHAMAEDSAGTGEEGTASALPMLLSDPLTVKRDGPGEAKPVEASLRYQATQPDSFADFKILETKTVENDGPKNSVESRLPTDAEKQVLRQFREHWTEKREVLERTARHRELEEQLAQTRAQLRAPAPKIVVANLPSNRYGLDTRLPPFLPDKHIPTLALINPFAGAMAGADILELARLTPYYQDRFFNIIDVVRDQRRGGLLDVLRQELSKAKKEAKAMGTRPRIISGGGDGTASFTLFILFAALRADGSREDEGLADTGNGFIWTDDEMAESFPALAQMPLGTTNDFGRTLGWGRKYPGDRESRFHLDWRRHAKDALLSWIEAAISPESSIANFDIFGIVPETGKDSCDFKISELGGHRGMDPKVHIDGKKHLVMKEAGLPVPLFVCLYFSAGFGAYMTARFQMNRRKSPIRNKLEYIRQGCGILAENIPPQLNVGLEKVEIFCGNERYFPPRSEDGSGGARYREVGFLNINWQAGIFHGAERAPLPARLCSTRDPAHFNDGLMDMYRVKFLSALKNPGLVFQTDKCEEGMTLTYSGAKGTGIFFQWDGESRFAFSPTGEPFHIHIRKIMSVPMVLGPYYDHRVTGNPDNGSPVMFGFSGRSMEERRRHSDRILQGVRGELNAELLATKADLNSMELPLEEDHLPPP